VRSPLHNGFVWQEFASVASTQTVAAEAIRLGSQTGVVFALDQTQGKGRFGRTWVSSPGESLTFSLIFHGYPDHPCPYLIGMAVAIAAAGVTRCQLRWPNDLVEGSKKVGGILTELISDPEGRRIPVVGVGINLNQSEFSGEIAEIATSLRLKHGRSYMAREIGQKIIERLPDLPEPTTWSDLAPIWALFDATPGKTFRLMTGETAVALGIGSDGQLMCSVDGESRSIYAADAIFGPPET